MHPRLIFVEPVILLLHVTPTQDDKATVHSKASSSRDMGRHRRNRRPRKSHRPQLGGVLTLVLCSQQADGRGPRD
jgi:hypothetical protein